MFHNEITIFRFFTEHWIQSSSAQLIPGLCLSYNHKEFHSISLINIPPELWKRKFMFASATASHYCHELLPFLFFFTVEFSIEIIVQQTTSENTSLLQDYILQFYSSVLSQKSNYGGFLTYCLLKIFWYLNRIEDESPSSKGLLYVLSKSISACFICHK